MDIPENIVNKKLYQQAKKEADIKYKRPGLYKSAFIQKRYQALGGKYKGPKPESKTELWFSQKWVDMEQYLKGKKVECGRNKNEMRKFPACRPLFKKGQNILTADEVIEKYGKQKVLKLIKNKQKDKNGRLMWKTGKFIPSKGYHIMPDGSVMKDSEHK